MSPLHSRERAPWESKLQQGPTAVRPTYRLIQVLRAVAALMVVAHHATIMLWERDRVPLGNWLAGSSGVDIFFVISGFVMTISSAPLRQTAHPARTFLARRIERVVPLYWLMTTLKLVFLLAMPALAINGLGSAAHTLGSYFFLPTLSPEGRYEPLVVVGWTLNFEMAFYLLFAGTLLFRRRAAPILIPLLLCFPLLILLPLTPLHWSVPRSSVAQFYMNSVLWEFALGVLLGTAVNAVRRWPWWLGLLLVVAGFYPLLTWNEPGVSYWRGVLWGVPALAVVTGAVLLEGRCGRYTPRLALELGDASYSIYLVHTFVLPALGFWLLGWHKDWPYEIPLAITTALLMSASAGELVYRGVELPIMRWFKGRRKTAVPANA